MIPTINKPTRVTRKTTSAIDHIPNNCFTETVCKTAISKVIYPIIFLFVFWFLRPQQKRKIKQLLSIKEYLTRNQLNHLRKNYMKLTGKKLKGIKIQTKHVRHFYKSLLPCMIIIFLKKD